MACLMNPDEKILKDNRYPNTRIKIGKEICDKCNCDWNVPVSFLQIPLVEQKYNCNIYILDVYNIPMLGSTISLLFGECLLYKSENRHSEKYYILYDEVKQHYDIITDIKKFMGVREFCCNCMKCFTHKSQYESHKCEEIVTKKRDQR